MLSCRIPVNFPSLPAPSAMVWMVAGWWPAIEYICARQLQTHWATQNLSRERRQDRMRPDISLATEATAQEVRYDIDLFLGYAEHDRQKLPGAEDVLGRLIERERRVGVPDRRRRVGLHLVVVAIGRRVGLLDLDGSRGDCLVSVADRRSDGPEKLRRNDGRFRALRTEHHRTTGVVLDPDQRPSMSGRDPGPGDDQSDWLAGVVDLVVLKR